MMNMKKPPRRVNRYIVESAASQLIAAEGRITSLTLKRYLRDRQGWACQADIDQWLHDTALKSGWSVSDTGFARIYSASYGLGITA